jgi:acetyl esterase/lipase
MVNRRQFLTAASMFALWAEIRAGGTELSGSLAKPLLPTRLPKAWQDAQVINLWPDTPPGAAGYHARQRPDDMLDVLLSNVSDPSLRVFRPDKPNGRGILVIPGGAYLFVSVSNEGLDVADALCPRGYTVFVLTYRLPGEGWKNRSDVPLQDAQRAMRIIRRKADEFEIDGNSLSVIGFSAGGHLAATLAVGHDETVYRARDENDELSAKPHSAALIYPVISMDSRWTHMPSRESLLGTSPTETDIVRRSPDRHVTKSTPPIFLVHAIDDSAVPVENSLLMFESMRQTGRPVETHFLEEGGHAFGMGIAGTSSGLWPDLYLAWNGRLSVQEQRVIDDE